MKLHLVKGWLSYAGSLRSPYRIHSPFVHELLTKVIRNKEDYREYRDTDRIRYHLLGNQSALHRVDFGSGSGGSTTVRQFVRSSAVSSKTGRLLFRLVRYLKPATILEVGTGSGVSTTYMLQGAENAQCVLLEGCPETAELASEQLRLVGMNTEITVGPFEETLPMVLQKLGWVDFVFIDGNHRERPTLDYFSRIADQCHESSCIAVHDIHWSAEMEFAWKMIRERKEVTITLDLFDVGLVFFCNQAKEHFALWW